MDFPQSKRTWLFRNIANLVTIAGLAASAVLFAIAN